MKVRYSRDTDTLYVELRAGEITELKDLDENTDLMSMPKEKTSVQLLLSMRVIAQMSAV